MGTQSLWSLCRVFRHHWEHLGRDSDRDSVFVESFRVKTAVFVESLSSL